jgi:hypothetical protein
MRYGETVYLGRRRTHQQFVEEGMTDIESPRWVKDNVGRDIWVSSTGTMTVQD